MFFNQLYETANLTIWILTGVLLLSFIIQLSYYLGVFRKTGTYQSKNSYTDTSPESKINDTSNSLSQTKSASVNDTKAVSIIICAKNEYDNLNKNLPAFLQQDYPNYEVIVVNDCSTDDSEMLLAEFSAKYPNLRYTNIPLDKKFRHGKKLAVTVGIKSALNNHLLFSDADCYPVSDQWISSMSRNFSDEKQLILGYGKYERKKGLLNTIIRYETLFTAIQYLSFAMKGKAFMGVGRNMAYNRELFFKHKGFASHLKVLSGDDDLFVNEASTKENTTVELSPESFTCSTPPSTWNEWFKQKKRHLSTAKYYKGASKSRLGIEYISRFFFYTSTIWLLTFNTWWMIALGVYLLLSIVRLIIVKMAMRSLDEWDLLVPSLILDPVLPVMLGIVRISNTIRPREAQWN